MRNPVSTPAECSVRPDSGATIVERLRRELSEAGLDCGCRDAAEAMLERIGAEQGLACRAEGLANARRIRDAIVIVTALLGELDLLTPEEPDRTAFHEIASLIQDITDFASCGASAARLAAGMGNS